MTPSSFRGLLLRILTTNRVPWTLPTISRGRKLKNSTRRLCNGTPDIPRFPGQLPQTLHTLPFKLADVER
ncbi:unnamed protein product, partial [Mesorhabditis spiculigera]